MSVAMSVELGTSMTVDFDDRMREIHDTGAAPEIEDTAIGAASRSFRNPSIVRVNCEFDVCRYFHRPTHIKFTII